MSDSTSLPKTLMLSIAVAQGVLLFALYKAFDAHVWPSESPLWSYPIWTLAIAVPVLLLLSLERGNERQGRADVSRIQCRAGGAGHLYGLAGGAIW